MQRKSVACNWIVLHQSEPCCFKQIQRHSIQMTCTTILLFISPPERFDWPSRTCRSIINSHWSNSSPVLHHKMFVFGGIRADFQSKCDQFPALRLSNVETMTGLPLWFILFPSNSVTSLTIFCHNPSNTSSFLFAILNRSPKHVISSLFC